MAFFLLGRVDDTLSLLCPDTFSSRQDAMAALSSVTAEPGFDLWDAEVLLLDTDTGTPVLLVRPRVATPDATVKAEDEPDVVVVAEPNEEPLETVVVDEVDADIVEIEDESAPEIVVEGEQGSVPEIEVDSDADAEPVVAVEDHAIADAITEEFEVEVEEGDAASALRDALTRTAAQMEADGIVAPESIGAPSSDVSGTEAAPVVDQDWPWDVATEPEPPVSPEIAFVLNDLEEPSLDDGSILKGSIDDATFAAARPVIMGSYAEPRDGVTSDVPALDDVPVDPMGLTDLETAISPKPGPSGFAVPVVSNASDIIELEPPIEEDVLEAESDSREQSSGADDEYLTDGDISDFILDLDTKPVVQPVTETADEPVAETPQVFDDMPGVVENTCDDCIYEDTCPNRDQRLPKDCGSFSWR